MTDTSPEIKKLQLEIWLKKSLSERLQLTVSSNEGLYLFWKHMKENNSKNKS